MTGREIRFRLLSLLGAGLLRCLGRSLRFELSGTEALNSLRADGRPFILAFWHAWILPLAYLHRKEGIVVLVSEHGDGEYIARIIHRMGFETTRGSSTRGGFRGIRGLVRGLLDGQCGGITPDGPRGPAGEFKPGALVAAQLSGAPVIPMAVSAPSAWRLQTWDRFGIPRPFGRIRVRYGTPLFIPRDADAEALNRYAGSLADFLNRGEVG